jgi:hypothetical protein
MNIFFYRTALCISLVLLLNTTFSFAQGHDKVRKEPNDIATDKRTTERTDSVPKKEKTPQPKEEFERWYYGGNVGFNFLNSGFAGNISPMVGYRLTPKFSVGGGVLLTGVSQQVQATNNKAYDLLYGQYGGRAFTRYVLFDGVFAHGEFEQAFNSRPTGNIVNDKVEYSTIGVPSLLGGLGANLNKGPIALNATLLYNVLYDTYDLNQQQASRNSFSDYRLGGFVLRGGIGIGF